jgi:serine protease Do
MQQMTTTPFRRTAIALALVGALGLGAVAADRVLPSTNAAPNAAPNAAASTAPAATAAAAASPLARSLPGFADLVAQQGKAVVRVSAVKEAPRNGGSGGPQFDPEQLPPFFRGLPIPDMPEPGPQRGQGSGFIVASDGVVLTNAHVVAGADEVTVTLTDQREFKAKVVGSDATTDVAVLKIDARDLPTVRLGDPARLRVGDWVVAIGTPYGLENTVTSGIVSAKSRALPGDAVVPFIQTDAAVNPGNSGGPLFNLDGEVVGINSQIFSRSGGFQGLAFAIPIDVALRVKDEIQQHGRVAHGRLGVNVQPVDQAIADSFGLEGPRGALVGSVQKGSPAARAGLEPGDVILRYDGRAVERSDALPAMVAATRPGTKAALDVWRNGKVEKLVVEVGERDAPKQLADAKGAGQGKLGVAVRPLTPEERKEAKLEGGVRVESVAGPAAKAGVRPGDVIVAVNRTPVASVEALREQVQKSEKSVALLIQRDDTRIFVPVRIG